MRYERPVAGGVREYVELALDDAKLSVRREQVGTHVESVERSFATAAEVLFRACIATGAKNFTEYRSSEAELRRMAR